MQGATPGVVETDVVVIGGGCAGVYAALRVQAEGLKVLQVVKGFLGRSGASIFAGNLQLQKTKDPAEEERFMAIRARYGSSYLNDPDYIKRASRFTEDVFYPEMEQRGLYLRRDDAGALVTSHDRNAGNVWAPNQGFSGTMIMELLRKDALARRLPLMQETMVTSLLVRNGVVAGVTALDIVRGEFFVIRAKAVIIATGPGNYLATRSTATREQCGNGFAMAYRAGADMQDLEMQWFHASDIAEPKSWMRLHLYPNPMPVTDQSIWLHGADRKMFFHLGMNPKVKQPYYLQLRHLYNEVERGNADWHGGFFGGYTHIEPEIMETYSYQAQFFKHLGIDITKDLVPCGVTWHMTFGGIRTDNRTFATTIQGLYAAGGCGSHGVGSITYVSYDGTVAALQACDRSRGTALIALPQDQVQREQHRVHRRLARKPEGGLLPAQVKKHVREIMTDRMGYVKSEARMSAALHELAEVRTDLLPAMGLGSTSRTWNYDWVEALDAEDMLDVCELTIRMSMQRKESRGYFFREDYPHIDNRNWLKHTVARRAGDGVAFEFTPAAPIFRPENEVDDFLTAEY
jgi:succinate dehydrogenase / fumarate reductase, flavoprotein subunit